MAFGMGRGRGKSTPQTDHFTPTHDAGEKASPWQLHRATRTRKIWALLTSFVLLITVVFLILVEIGNVADKPVLTSIWFIKLDLTNVVPATVPNAVLINSIARTIGLHDFYQVGLWSFCEGYNGEGVTHCSDPRALYWFNPVQIMLNELLAGATIALPASINHALDLLKVASQWMFGFFLTGACLSFVLIFVGPLSLYSRWAALPIAILAALNALVVTIAAVLATVMFIVLKNVFVGQTQVNIEARLGTKMFALMWVASAFSILAALVQTGLCCCCASRRDVRRGKKTGSRKAWEADGTEQPDKPRRRWGLRRG